MLYKLKEVELDQKISIRCGDCGFIRKITEDYVSMINKQYNYENITDIEEFLRTNSHRLKCKCGKKNASIIRRCHICNQTIAEERIESIPTINICFSCQVELESRSLMDDDQDFGKCPRCGMKLVQRIRKKVIPAAYFVGCSGYPKCRYTVD